MKKDKPLLIVGLGNPGTRYGSTRHNVGFMAVDFLAGADATWKKEKNSLTARGNNIIYAKPQTFMNLSGAAVQALMTFYKIPPQNLIVIHDDLDMEFGKVRTKTGGGAGGHNGIKSIDSAIGNNYQRIKIGIGRPGQNKFPSRGGVPRRGGEGQNNSKTLPGATRHPSHGGELLPSLLSMIFGPPRPMSVSDYVLSKFSPDELRELEKIFDGLGCLLSE